MQTSVVVLVVSKVCNAVVTLFELPFVQKIAIAPYESDKMRAAYEKLDPLERFEHHAFPRVVTVTWGHGDAKDSTMAAFLDSMGELRGNLQLHDFSNNESHAQLEQFLVKSKPDIVGVAGYNLNTRRLLGEVQECVRQYDRGRSREMTPVVVVDDEVARLYPQSKPALDEFRSFPPLMRYCIALARCLQNPLNEYAALETDLLTIRHHPLQTLLPEEVLTMYLERALVNVVNDVGVDINAALKKKYQGHLLQYVCGLGPRKVQSLVTRIERSVSVEDIY